MTLQPQTSKQAKCPHTRISGRGSNSVQERVTCVDCGLCLGMVHYGRAPDAWILQLLKPCQGASASSLGHGELSAPEVLGTANGTATDLGSSRSGQFQRERGGEPPGSATSTGDHKQEELCHSGAKLSSCGDPCTCTGVNSSSGGDQHHELRGSGPGGARASVARY